MYSFSLNGELLVDPAAGDAAFGDVHADGSPFVPAFTLCTGQKCRLNFGHNVDSLRFFTMCGLQEGYEPFCVNMTRSVTFWYTKSLPIFENNEVNSLPLYPVILDRACQPQTILRVIDRTWPTPRST